MTVSAIATQPLEAKPVDNTTNSAAAAPRKRRRRAPATGASEDCFACKKRQVKCDRRRPYCGQCVEIGKDCSGYRTTLTWGVGVASRGKLRGMSLPVAKSPPAGVSQETKAQARKNSTATISSSTTAASHQTHGNFHHRGSVDFGLHSPTSPTSPNLYSAPQEYHYLGPTSPIPIPSPSTPMGFHMPQSGDHFDYLNPHHSKLGQHHLHRAPLQRLQTTMHTSFDDNGMSASSASLGTYSDSDLPSPSEFPHTPVDDCSLVDPFIPRYSFGSHDHCSQMGSSENHFFHEAPRPLPVVDDMNSSVSSDQSIHDYAEISPAQQSMGTAALQDMFFEGEMSSSVTGFQPGFSFLPSDEPNHRFAPFPADAIASGLLRQIYMPGSGGF